MHRTYFLLIVLLAPSPCALHGELSRDTGPEGRESGMWFPMLPAIGISGIHSFWMAKRNTIYINLLDII